MARIIVVELPDNSPEELDEVAQSIWKHLENSRIEGSRCTSLPPELGVRVSQLLDEPKAFAG